MIDFILRIHIVEELTKSKLYICTFLEFTSHSSSDFYITNKLRSLYSISE